jgi:hypothetical protein
MVNKFKKYWVLNVIVYFKMVQSAAINTLQKDEHIVSTLQRDNKNNYTLQMPPRMGGVIFV